MVPFGRSWPAPVNCAAQTQVPTINRVALFDSTDRRRYEQELLHARKRAEDAARSLAAADAQKNEFIAMVAHELRNPLAPVRNALDLMRRSGNEPTIVNQGDRGPASAGGADGSAGRGPPRHQSRRARQVVDPTRCQSTWPQSSITPSKPVSPLLDHAGLSYTVALPDAPIYIDADAARLAQVIGNILNNASKFTPRGGSVALCRRSRRR